MNLKAAIAKAKSELADKKEARLKAAKTGGKNNSTKGKMSDTMKKSFRNFRVKTMGELISVNTASKKFAYLPQEEKDAIKALKEQVDIALIESSIFGIDVVDTKAYQEELQFTLKAFGIESGNAGFDWIPTEVSSSYIEEFNLERKISGLFTEIKMPTNPYDYPVQINGAIARKVAQASAGKKQEFGTGVITFRAQKLTSRFELPEELHEDSAVDVLRLLREELMEGQEKALEISILEGDKSGALHHFTQLPDEAVGTTIASIASESCETAFDGLRKRVLASTGSTADAGGLKVSEPKLSEVRKKMGKFGVDPKPLAWVMGPMVYNDCVELDDVKTIEQYGGQATILSGELAKYNGMPIIVSEYFREDVDATGVNSAIAANNVLGSVMLVNRKRFWCAVRRPIQVRIENNKTEYDVTDLVSFCRKAFQGVLKEDGSNYATESSAAMLINLAI